MKVKELIEKYKRELLDYIQIEFRNENNYKIFTGKYASYEDLKNYCPFYNYEIIEFFAYDNNCIVILIKSE